MKSKTERSLQIWKHKKNPNSDSDESKPWGENASLAALIWKEIGATLPVRL